MQTPGLFNTVTIKVEFMLFILKGVILEVFQLLKYISGYSFYNGLTQSLHAKQNATQGQFLSGEMLV